MATMTNDLRIKRLTEFKNLMDNHDKYFKSVKFNISTWAEIKGRKNEAKYCESGKKTLNCDIIKKLDCGSAACALGSAAMHTPFMRQGLTLKNIGSDGYVDFVPRFKGYNNITAGEEFFGITSLEGKYLFMPSAYHSPTAYFLDISWKKVKTLGLDNPINHVKPKHVSARIEKLIESYRYDKKPLLA